MKLGGHAAAGIGPDAEEIPLLESGVVSAVRTEQVVSTSASVTSGRYPQVAARQHGAAVLPHRLRREHLHADLSRTDISRTNPADYPYGDFAAGDFVSNDFASDAVFADAVTTLTKRDAAEVSATAVVDKPLSGDDRCR